MNYIFKTKNVALLAAMIIAFGDVYAARRMPESPPNNSCKDNCHKNFWVSGDLLYWTACEGGFGCDFGTTSITNTITPGRVVTDIQEEDEDIDFDWNFGFRIGAGYNFRECWDIGANWTHFNGHGKGHDGKNHARWRLRLNQVDLDAGYKLKYGKHFSLRPFFGARYALINQKLKSHLESVISVPPASATSTAISSKKDREHFWGAGPQAGFEGDFYFGPHFNLYGSLGGDLLYGRFKSKFNDSDVFAAAISNCHSTSESCAILTGLDMGLGLRFLFKHLILQLGWEHHIYFDYNQIGCDGDLNLYGANASVVIRF